MRTLRKQILNKQKCDMPYGATRLRTRLDSSSSLLAADTELLEAPNDAPISETRLITI